MRPHGVERKYDLAAVLHPAAMLGHAVFADVKGVKNGRTVRSQVEGEDPLRRIRRRRVALISTSKISPLPPGKADGDVSSRARQLGSGANGRNEPAKRHQGTRKVGTDANKAGSSSAHDD